MTKPSSTTLNRLGQLAFWLSVALLLGRVLGFVRELVLARLLGISVQSDQAVILLALPDMFVNILLAGGLGGALIPALSRASGKDRVEIISQFISLVCLLFVPISLCVALFPDVIIQLLAPGAQFPPTLALQVQWISVAIMFSALTGVFSAWLNAENRFFIAGSGGLIFNAIVLLALCLFWYRNESNALDFITAGIVFACAIRLLITLAPVCQQMCSAWPTSLRFPESLLLKQFLFALAAVGLVQVLPVIVRAFATQVEPGALTAFNYAHKLIELPVGVALASVGIVILPTLSALHLAKDPAGFNQVLFSALRKTMLLSLVMLGAALLLLPWAIKLLFGGGAMTAKGLSHTLDLALIISWTLPLVGVSNVAMSALNAMSRQGVLAICALVALAVSTAYLSAILQPGAYNTLGSSMIVFYASFSLTTLAALFWARRSL